MTQTARILIVDDEEAIRFTLGALLKKDGYLVEGAGSCADALLLLSQITFDLVFSDILLTNESGMDLLHDIKISYPSTPVVLFTGRPELDTAIKAVQEGAFDYLTKPVKYDTMQKIVRLAIKSKKMRDQEERYRADLDAIFRSISDAVIMIDNEGKLLQFNEAARSLCGYTEKNIGYKNNQFEFECNGICYATIVKSLQDGKENFVKRMECCKKNRIAKIINLTVTPVLDCEKKTQGVVAVVRDETRLVQLEQTLYEREHFHGIIGQNRAMQKLYDLVEALADLPTTVLINGESGTGKELVAAALHHGGCRSKGPFIKVNCSALSETLLENELFGHIRGAFTGALDDKKGRFERADGGTIFLDEIGDISPGMQMRLLRVLQELVVERVGDSTPIKIDVRVVTATNQNLEEKVRQGSFRQDLYYRLNVMKLHLPPLRERTDDIQQLAEHFLKQFSTRFSRAIRSFSDDVLKTFMRYPWQGNVRELEHVVEHACILCRGVQITVNDLPEELKNINISAINNTIIADEARFQLMTLEEALAICNGNKSQAAKMLGISRRTVYRHLE